MKEVKRGNSLIRHVIDVNLNAGAAEPGPPLGTILGNQGVNTVKFCKDFNEVTKSLPNYLVLTTRIVILENRTCTFTVRLPSISYFLNLFKVQKSAKVRHHDRIHVKVFPAISLKALLQICKFKFPFDPIKSMLPSVISTARSCNIRIFKSI